MMFFGSQIIHSDLILQVLDLALKFQFPQLFIKMCKTESDSFSALPAYFLVSSNLSIFLVFCFGFINSNINSVTYLYLQIWSICNLYNGEATATFPEKSTCELNNMADFSETMQEANIMQNLHVTLTFLNELHTVKMK